MKNASHYQKEIRKLLAGMKKVKPASASEDPLQALLEGILQSDTIPKHSARALANLQREFMDFNELRVAPVKDIVNAVGRDFPRAREKAESLIKSLNRIFDRTYQLSMDYVAKMGKRDMLRHLSELGLNPFASAYVMLFGYGHHAIPTDQALLESLQLDGKLPPACTLDEARSLLERVVGTKDAFSAHEFLRQYVDDMSKALAKKHKADAAVQAAAQAAKEQKAADAAARAAAAAASRQAKDKAAAIAARKVKVRAKLTKKRK